MTQIVLRRTPDGYTRDLHCLEVVTTHQRGRKAYTGRGWDYRVQILDEEGAFLGVLHCTFGGDGYGLESADRFIPADGVKVKYI